MQLHTQLNFGGNCREAFTFYADKLGGRILMMLDDSQLPGAQPGSGKSIIHARMTIGGSVLIGNDVPANVFQKMRSAYLFFSLDSPSEAERVHAILADGGEIFMQMQETFFATRFSMLRDRFGVSWTVIHERPMAP